MSMCAPHLSQGGLALEEVRVLAALRRVELGVEEGAAVGDGLQGGGALVGEGQAHKQLQRKRAEAQTTSVASEATRSRLTLTSQRLDEQSDWFTQSRGVKHSAAET